MCMALKYNIDNFITKANRIHNNEYDYSVMKYINSQTKIDIVCAIHGIFKQIPASHISGRGCPKCGGKYKLTTDTFINKAKQIHGNKYDYSHVNYVNDGTNVIIICKLHGKFTSTPNNHTRSHNPSGCPHCGFNLIKEKNKMCVGEYIKRANVVHNNKYNYSLVEYYGSHNKIKIICPNHGEFEQIACDHINKKCGCPKCVESVGEKQIRKFLEKNKIIYIKEKCFGDCYHKIKLPFDFYLPEINVLIEYDGIQHYEPINFFGGLNALTSLQKRDEIKTKFANDNGIKLIRIKYNENVEEILQYVIL